MVLKKSNFETVIIKHINDNFQKKINIKNRPYYSFSDMINIKNFDLNLLNIDKISFINTNAVTYRIKYTTMKSLDHVNIDCENSLYLDFDNVDG